ncbi:hypothetical protein, partial [Lonsdalea populi]|uniref:hypothetical protein n=1 Tax=Lonsdalea populi TaxID=1172565 RepID=UPI001C655CC5
LEGGREPSSGFDKTATPFCMAVRLPEGQGAQRRRESLPHRRGQRKSPEHWMDWPGAFDSYSTLTAA